MYKKMQVCAVVWYLDFKIEKDGDSWTCGV